MGDERQVLFEAIAAGEREACARLVKDDPSLASAKDETGISALRRALYAGEGAIATHLAEAGARLDVFDAAALGDLETLERHLQASPELLSERAADGFAPLHLAAFFGQRAVVARLLALGASVAAVAENPSRVQPLHSAVAMRHAEIADLLIARGADPNAAQQGGFTPLHSAALHGEDALVDALLAAGADPRAVANDGRDAVAFAREGGHEALAARLEEQGEPRGTA